MALRFDLDDSIPTNAMVIGATLELFAASYIGGSQTGDYGVFTVSRAWNEDEATWANATKDQAWAKAGGDFIAKVIAKATCPRSVGPVWVKYNVLSAVQEFVKNPAVNYGLMLINIKGSQEIDFPSSENANAEHRPKLTISYTVPSGVISSVPAVEVRSGLIVRPQRQAMYLDGSDLDFPFEITISRLDGKSLFHDRFAARGQNQLIGLGKGVYIISVKELNRRQHSVLTVMP